MGAATSSRRSIHGSSEGSPRCPRQDKRSGLRESGVQMTDPQGGGHDSREQGAVDDPGQRGRPRRMVEECHERSAQRVNGEKGTQHPDRVR